MNTTQFVKALVMGALIAFTMSACRSEPQGAGKIAACPVIESRNWTAHVNRMPGPDAKPMLIVQGEVELPTPGYQPTLRAGRADRSATPVQQLVLDLVPPGGIVAQVLSTETVRYQGPAIAAQYRGVAIMCGGKAIAEIAEVPAVY